MCGTWPRDVCAHVYTHVHAHVYTHVYAHVYTHVFWPHTIGKLSSRRSKKGDPCRSVHMRWKCSRQRRYRATLPQEYAALCEETRLSTVRRYADGPHQTAEAPNLSPTDPQLLDHEVCACARAHARTHAYKHAHTRIARSGVCVCMRTHTCLHAEIHVHADTLSALHAPHCTRAGRYRCACIQN